MTLTFGIATGGTAVDGATAATDATLTGTARPPAVAGCRAAECSAARSTTTWAMTLTAGTRLASAVPRRVTRTARTPVTSAFPNQAGLPNQAAATAAATGGAAATRARPAPSRPSRCRGSRRHPGPVAPAD